jgi:hypothetical protein
MKHKVARVVVDRDLKVVSRGKVSLDSLEDCEVVMRPEVPQSANKFGEWLRKWNYEHNPALFTARVVEKKRKSPAKPASKKRKKAA